MKQTLKKWFVSSVVLLAGAGFVYGQSTEGKRLMNHATGPFEVKVVPSGHTPSGSEEFGEMSFTKVLSGNMVGTSKGLMLTSSTSSSGAMAYVALETVTASLHGSSGTFVLMHNATTRKGEPEADSLHIVVVPGSGTGALTGITGTLVIQKGAQGNHFYSFEYDLP
ncbi:hypothetical protein AciX9_4694 (plasmid) [Granulicella tundricola MP5ACTX9]|uniref:DUF3224 domain-containing protein n=2 Tax=Granulicella TaxID=940557 RepID=E8X837_GRATM|nr:hypothetical protein AciX9_4694 [Granulicella tundricola MP5ACTX9]